MVITAVLATLIFFIWLWGRTLPATHEIEVSRNINAPIEHVWNILTNWEEQTQWRKDIKSIKTLSPDSFIEQPKNGPPITFKISKSEPPYKLELVMSGFFDGYYRVNLTFSGGVTTVLAYERVTQNLVFGRILYKLFFDLDKFASGYLEQLADYIENS